jgi:hypothetical protein
VLNVVGKTPEFFHRKLSSFNKEEQTFAEITTVTSKSLFISLKVSYRIVNVKDVILLEKV